MKTSFGSGVGEGNTDGSAVTLVLWVGTALVELGSPVVALPVEDVKLGVEGIRPVETRGGGERELDDGTPLLGLTVVPADEVPRGLDVLVDVGLGTGLENGLAARGTMMTSCAARSTACAPRSTAACAVQRHPMSTATVKSCMAGVFRAVLRGRGTQSSVIYWASAIGLSA